MNLNALAIQHFKCPSCGAKPKQFCRTFKPTLRTDTVHVYGVNHVHEPRVAVLREVWFDGCRAGQANPQLADLKKEKVSV